MAVPSQLLLAQMSNFTCTAYAAYSIVSQNYWDNQANSSVPIITPVQAIQTLQPYLTNINPIFVYESETGKDAAADAKRKSVPEKKTGESLASIAADNPCGFTVTNGYPDGFQLFGFAATVPATRGLPSENIVALRGTVTDYEGFQSLNGWDDAPVPADMPTGASSGSSVGNIQTNYWSFYSGAGGIFGDKPPLSQSFKQALTAVVKAQPNLPLYGTAHSLGGAMLSLGMLDANLSSIFNSAPQMVTFGSVVAGDETWSKSYTSITGPQNTFRVANEADFVPSLRGLTPGPPLASYTHVGVPLLFVWQTDSDWDNHNLQFIYQPTVSNPSLFKNIYVANKPVAYPVGITKFGSA